MTKRQALANAAMLRSALGELLRVYVSNLDRGEFHVSAAPVNEDSMTAFCCWMTAVSVYRETGGNK